MFSLRKYSLLILSLALMSAMASTTQPAEDLLARGQADQAIGLLHTALAQNPSDAGSYHLLCRAHFDFQDWNSAVSACEKAAALNPQSSREHLWLGRSYGEKADASNFLVAVGLAKKVHAEFETAVQLDPQNIEAHTDLAEFYLEAPSMIGGGRDKAESQAQILASLEPSKSHWVKARIAEKDHDFTAAEKEYRAAIEASKGGAIDWFNLASFYGHRNRMDDMQQALQHAVTAPPAHPEVTMEAAESLIRVDRNIPLAISWLQKYLAGPTVELAPTFKAYYWLGQAQEKQSNFTAAAASYRSALELAHGYTRAREALDRISEDRRGE
jgi:tetratricopeptide (TPR) repeat protein